MGATRLFDGKPDENIGRKLRPLILLRRPCSLELKRQSHFPLRLPG
jgi:hypothetical protein